MSRALPHFDDVPLAGQDGFPVIRHANHTPLREPSVACSEDWGRAINEVNED